MFPVWFVETDCFSHLEQSISVPDMWTQGQCSQAQGHLLLRKPLSQAFLGVASA